MRKTRKSREGEKVQGRQNRETSSKRLRDGGREGEGKEVQFVSDLASRNP